MPHVTFSGKINCILYQRVFCTSLSHYQIIKQDWLEKSDLLEPIEVTSGFNDVVYDITLLLLNIPGMLHARDFFVAKHSSRCSKEGCSALISLFNTALNCTGFWRLCKTIHDDKTEIGCLLWWSMSQLSMMDDSPTLLSMLTFTFVKYDQNQVYHSLYCQSPPTIHLDNPPPHDFYAM